MRLYTDKDDEKVLHIDGKNMLCFKKPPDNYAFHLDKCQNLIIENWEIYFWPSIYKSRVRKWWYLSKILWHWIERRIPNE